MSKLKIIAIALVLFFATTASAATGLSIRPVKIVQTIRPGQVITGTLTVSNASDGPVEVVSNAQDFMPVADSDTFQIVSRAPGVTVVADWFRFRLDEKDAWASSTTFKLDRDGSKAVEYQILAPDDAEPGSHFGVALFEARPQNEGTAGEQLKVGVRVGALIFATVPGNRLENGQLIKFNGPQFIQSAPVDFELAFKNTGTVHFEPRGQIKIYNMFGGQVGEVPIAGHVTLPTGVKDFAVRWDGPQFLLGRYSALASVFSSDGRLLGELNLHFYAVPWKPFALVVIIALAFFLAFYLLRSRLNISISLKKTKARNGKGK